MPWQGRDSGKLVLTARKSQPPSSHKKRELESNVPWGCQVNGDVLGSGHGPTPGSWLALVKALDD